MPVAPPEVPAHLLAEMGLLTREGAALTL